MAILKVAQLGHPKLRLVARDLSPEEILSPAIRSLVQDMHETMAEYGGVGLAAPQVHHSLRLALVQRVGAGRYAEAVDAGAEPEAADQGTADPEDPSSVMVLFNSRLTVLDPTPQGMWEGCLSVEGLRGYVERPTKIRVEYLDAEAQPQVLEAEGFFAVVLQHELDHLDGVLYVDRLADPRKFAFADEYMRYHSGS